MKSVILILYYPKLNEPMTIEYCCCANCIMYNILKNVNNNYY